MQHPLHGRTLDPSKPLWNARRRYPGAQSDVSHAADTLLRAGNRPTVEKIRTKLGRGSPNTINPMLDTWWKTLSARLDSGPAALHRLPGIGCARRRGSLDASPRRRHSVRALLEQRDNTRLAELRQRTLPRTTFPRPSRFAKGELDFATTDRDSYDQRSHRYSAPRAHTPAAQGTGDARITDHKAGIELPVIPAKTPTIGTPGPWRQEKRPRGKSPKRVRPKRHRKKDAQNVGGKNGIRSSSSHRFATGSRNGLDPRFGRGVRKASRARAPVTRVCLGRCRASIGYANSPARRRTRILDFRLRDRTIEDLNLRLRDFDQGCSARSKPT